MRPAFFASREYKKKQAEIVHLNWQKGVYNSLVKKEQRNCLNRYCKNHFIVSKSDTQKYCSQNCWYLVRRNYKLKTLVSCLTCGKLVTQKGAFKFCSLKCQAKNNFNEYVSRWKQGLENGNRGINTKNLSKYLRTYLLEKFDEKCSICGWNQRNPVTNVVPVEV